MPKRTPDPKPKYPVPVYQCNGCGNRVGCTCRDPRLGINLSASTVIQSSAAEGSS